jgi:uncharacterized Rmd1/YagE family protein
MFNNISTGVASMKREIELVALHLTSPLTRSDIEKAMNVTLKKGIEATYYVEIDDKVLAYTQFNVLTLINWSRVDIVNTLETLGIEGADDFDKSGNYQEYPLLVDTALAENFAIDNDKITLKSYSSINLMIVSHVISQSVALEIYEQKLSDYYEQSRYLIDSADTYSIFKRTHLSRFAKQLVLIRHDMMIDLLLLDKPNILWDNENAEMLYNRLANMLDLTDRFDVVEYKLKSIKDDIVMVMDLTNHNHSSFLEWIIIVLIAVEIGMGLFEWFKMGFGH